MLGESEKLEEDKCPLCSNKVSLPRVLTCLHVFCEACLDKMLINEAGDSKVESMLKCPLCEQETIVGSKGAASLPCDYVLANILEMSTIENTLCTSCKSMEKAVSRCSDCANFLCPHCNTAHQFMRCFENHKVIAFEDLMKSKELIPIHKPIFCEKHPAENMKFYCNTCQELICNECLFLEHQLPDHQYERLIDAESRSKDDFLKLLNETKTKIANCHETSDQRENVLGKLQVESDNAKDSIMESFHHYEAVLKKVRDLFLSELESLHSERELKVMDYFDSLDKTLEKLDAACCFTSRLFKHGETVEILSLRRIVINQLTSLERNMQKPVSFSIEFQTDFSHFEKTVKTAFGSFRTEVTPNSANIPGSMDFETIPLSFCPSSISKTSSISSTSKQSSFEGEPCFRLLPLPIGSQNFLSPPSTSPDSIGLASIQEYSLQQLANHSEKIDSGAVGLNSNSSPAPSFADLFTDHGVSNFSKFGISLGNRRVNNVALNSGGNFIIRHGQSMVDSPNLSTLDFDVASCPPLSSCASPIMSSTAGSEFGGSMHNIPVMLRNSNASISGNKNLTRIRASGSKFPPMIIRHKFGELGSYPSQFNSPHGFCLGGDEDIIIADTNNHRIQVFEKSGVFKFEFGVAGKEAGQLWYPRKVAVKRSNGKFVVCDRGNARSRMQIFAKDGHFIRTIPIHFIDIVAGLAVTDQGYIVAVDSVSPTIYILSETGNLVNQFSCSDYMREPSDIAVNEKEYFVCDFKGHCVVVFNEEGEFLRRIGCEMVTNYPNGIDISDAGDVLIGDSHGNRFHVVVFSRDGSFLSEFECPNVKVSRCCGLKITSEGYVVTLAKNNHHVLILNTLYIM